MTLTIGTGPFGRQSHGTFNFDTGVLQPHTLYFEDSPRRVRVTFNGETIADSKRVKLLHETGHCPSTTFPKRTSVRTCSKRATILRTARSRAMPRTSL
jgi:uncharacterized protein (DUF427 family)